MIDGTMHGSCRHDTEEIPNSSTLSPLTVPSPKLINFPKLKNKQHYSKVQLRFNSGGERVKYELYYECH